MIRTDGLLLGLERPPIQPEKVLKHLPSENISREFHRLPLVGVGLAHRSP